MKIIWLSSWVMLSCFSGRASGFDSPMNDPFLKITTPKPSSYNGSISQPDLDGVVEVSFRIDSEGKIQVLSINSTSPQLADYVIKKLEKVRLEQGSSETGKIIKYSFVFKKQA